MNFWSWNPERNIVRWAWVYRSRYRAEVATAASDTTWAHSIVHGLRTRAQVAEFTDPLGPERA